MYRALGYYKDCDDAICVDCIPNLPSVVPHAPNPDYPWWLGFESWEAPLCITESDESDSPTHCVECGALIEHDLTHHGYMSVFESVIEGFTEGKQNPVVVQWIDAYEEYLPDSVDACYFDLPDGGCIDFDDALKLYKLLPQDKEWIEREDLRKHAVQAGWIEGVAE